MEIVMSLYSMNCRFFKHPALGCLWLWLSTHQTLKSMLWFNCTPTSSKLKIGPPFACYAANAVKAGLMNIMIKTSDCRQKSDQPDKLRLRRLQKSGFGMR